MTATNQHKKYSATPEQGMMQMIIISQPEGLSKGRQTTSWAR